MPRQGRVVLPNYPLHVVQRGHNRQVVFAEDEDYQRYLSITPPALSADTPKPDGG